MEYVGKHKFRDNLPITRYNLQVDSFDVEALSARSKVKGLRSKVEAICYRHQPSPIAISHSQQLYLSHSFTSTGNNSYFIYFYIFHQRRRLHNEYFCMNMHKRRGTGWFDNAVANRHFHRTTPKHLWKCRNDSVRVQLRTNENSGKLQRMFRSGSADVQDRSIEKCHRVDGETFFRKVANAYLFILICINMQN